MYKFVIRPILFLFPPEFVHNLSFFFLKIICNIPIISFLIKQYFSSNKKELNKSVFNLNFKNSIGLAAGFDKNAVLVKELSLFGFGHIEIGTVTPKSQKGNKKPRLFRLKKFKSLINRIYHLDSGYESIERKLKSLGAKIKRIS